jgi:hypothetical protein
MAEVGEVESAEALKSNPRANVFVIQNAAQLSICRRSCSGTFARTRS